jgi:hypothetical protein
MIYMQPTISGSDDLAEPDEVQEPEPRLPRRQIGYFDIHADSAGDEDKFGRLAQATSDIEPSRGEVTPLRD